MAKRLRNVSTQVESVPNQSIILKTQTAMTEIVPSSNSIVAKSISLMVEYTGVGIPYNLVRARNLVIMIEYTGNPETGSVFGPIWQMMS